MANVPLASAGIGVSEGVGAGAVGAALGRRNRVLGDVALGGDVGAEAGVAVVGGRTGQDQADAVVAAGHLGHGEARCPDCP